MEAFLGESHFVDVQTGLDLNDAFVGKRIDMQKVERLAIVIAVNAGIAANIVLSLTQHQTAAGGTGKALPYVGMFFYRVSTDEGFTKVEVDAANPLAEIDLSTIFATKSGVVILEVMQEFLDVDNNFRFVNVASEDATVASPASVTYIGQAKHLPAYTDIL